MVSQIFLLMLLMTAALPGGEVTAERGRVYRPAFFHFGQRRSASASAFIFQPSGVRYITFQ
ncbi:hypothetical protein BB405_26450 (plasmid) [Escherichia coli]|nr:hypothetical protein BB405_26450 [Escherichia coli]